jgi:hypothetical protein
MNRILFLIFLLASWVGGSLSHAELLLDLSKKPKQVEATLKPLFESVIRPYGDKHSADFGGLHGKQGTGDSEGSKFAWIFSGKRLLSSIGSYTPEIVPLDDCAPDPDQINPDTHCNWRRTRFNVCHLFMFNGDDLKLANVARLNIVRDKKQLVGLPLCYGASAMAVAKIIPDAMLITMEYSDSAEPADKHFDPPYFYTTVLLRFSDKNGKLKIEQDDSCLGNPNTYKTIAAARKALKQCGHTKPSK